MPKTIIVTGASRGIGAAVAREAARLGLNLVLTARSGDALGALAESLDPPGKRVAAVPGDISEKETCSRVVETALKRFGGIDVLNHFNRMLSAEYPEITAIAVSPGMTATDMQVAIRETGGGRMPEDEHRRFVEAHRRGELRSPEQVARAIVAIGVNAPRKLTGEFVTVEDPRVEALIKPPVN